MTKVYQDCSYQVAVLSKQATAARAQFILKRVRAAN